MRGYDIGRVEQKAECRAAVKEQGRRRGRHGQGGL